MTTARPLTSRTVAVVVTVSPIRTGVLKTMLADRKIEPSPGSLVPEQRRDIADGQRAVRHPPPEHGLAGILFVEMDRIHVAGRLAEHLDVMFGDGALDLRRHARLEFIEIDAGHGFTI